MKNYVPVLKRTRLFSGVSEDEIRAMLNCLKARFVEYSRGDAVLRHGEHLDQLLLLLEGSLQIQRDDNWGNRAILDSIAPGEMFGEAYLAPESSALCHDIVALKDSVVVFVNARKVLTVCSSMCRFHYLVIQNLFFSISEKNKKLIQKLNHMSRRTLREKLISYLSEEARVQGSTGFTIPFNRQQLADYLAVDRSAMSRELCKMRDEGLIRFERSFFELL